MRLKIVSMPWKFYFWPIVWSFILIPSLVYPLLLDCDLIIFSRIIGIILLFYSLFLSSSGGRTLARLAHKEAHETFWPDKFTTFGVFGCMRHPMHLGLAILPLSVSLISGYVLAILASGWGVAASLWFVIQVEEKDTINKFGNSYTNYMQKVPPFSLNISCIKEALKIWKTL